MSRVEKAVIAKSLTMHARYERILGLEILKLEQRRRDLEDRSEARLREQRMHSETAAGLRGILAMMTAAGAVAYVTERGDLGSSITEWILPDGSRKSAKQEASE